MTSPIVDQPAPVPQGQRRPVWEAVIEYVGHMCDANAYGAYKTTGVVDRVIADMRDRDLIGRERYGTPLTSGNGRDHLVDAHQELLDGCVYLATELDEHGISPSTLITEDLVPDTKARWRLVCVQQLLADQVRAAISLRAQIEGRLS